jgi:hypothetical protein
MEELLKEFVGKQVDIAFARGSIVRGEVSRVYNGIVYLVDEEKRPVFVAADKISVVWELKEAHSRPGFVI